MNSLWLKCISTDGALKAVALEATSLVQEIIDLHASGLSPDLCTRLGESILAGILLASQLKQGERINLNLWTEGPRALVDAYPEGWVRGLIYNTQSVPKINQGPWGEGLFSVLRTQHQDHLAVPKTYKGTVPMLTGFLAKDLSFYLAQSEQIPSAVGIFCEVSSKKKVQIAQAFLIQPLPGAPESQISALESQLTELEKSLYERHSTPQLLLSALFKNNTFVILEEKELLARCFCSQERVDRALRLLGEQEIVSMLKSPPGPITCDFCKKNYGYGPKELETLLKELQSKSVP